MNRVVLWVGIALVAANLLISKQGSALWGVVKTGGESASSSAPSSGGGTAAPIVGLPKLGGAPLPNLTPGGPLVLPNYGAGGTAPQNLRPQNPPNPVTHPGTYGPAGNLISQIGSELSWIASWLGHHRPGAR